MTESSPKSNTNPFHKLLAIGAAISLGTTNVESATATTDTEQYSTAKVCEILKQNPATAVFNKTKQRFTLCKEGNIIAEGKSSTAANKNKKWDYDGNFVSFRKKINYPMTNADKPNEVYGKYTYIFDLKGKSITGWNDQSPIYGKEIENSDIAAHIAGKKRQADPLYGKVGLSGGCFNIPRELTSTVLYENPELFIAGKQNDLIKLARLAAQTPDADKQTREIANFVLKMQVQENGNNDPEHTITMNQDGKVIYKPRNNPKLTKK